MTLASNIQDLATRIAQEFKSVRTAIALKNDKTYFDAFRLYPVIRYTGSAWPTRTSSLPTGYTGPVVYDSTLWSAAPTPTDRVTGDIWDRVPA